MTRQLHFCRHRLFPSNLNNVELLQRQIRTLVENVTPNLEVGADGRIAVLRIVVSGSCLLTLFPDGSG